MADDAYNTLTPLPPVLRRLRQLSLPIAVIAIVVALLGLPFDPSAFYNGYLFGWWFWLGLSLGSLAVLMMHTLTGGYWGGPIRRHLESAARVLPIVAVLVIPILIGRAYIFPWANPDLVKANEVLTKQSHYMTLSLFTFRVVMYFAIWSLLAVRVSRLGYAYDRTGDHRYLAKMQATAAPGEVLLAITVTAAAVDFLMCRDAGWFSTMYGFIILAGQLLGAIVFSLVMMRPLRLIQPVRDLLTPDTLNDIGNLFLAFTVFWFYVTFGQFLIIWMGDEKTDSFWFTNRGMGQFYNPWVWWAVGLALLGFLIPFALLLQRPVKRNIMTISGLAICVMFMRLADIYWQIKPSGIGAGYNVSLTVTAVVSALWHDLPMPIAIGGIWMFFYLGNLASRPLVGRSVDEEPGHATAAHGGASVQTI
jgi:hypothetical protein